MLTGRHAYAWSLSLAILTCGGGLVQANAQTPATVQQTSGYVASYDLLGYPTLLCDLPNQDDRPAFKNVCSSPGGSPLTGLISANASFTGLGVYTHVGADGSDPALFAAAATASAYIRDQFFFAGAVPSQLLFHLALTGDPTFTRPSGTDLSYHAAVSFTAGGAQGSNSGFLQWTWNDGDSYLGDPQLIMKTQDDVLVPGSASMTVGLGLQAFANLRASNGHLAGDVVGDFSHTGRIAYIQAFDDNGTDISDQVQMTTASGTAYQFGAPVTTAPEPGSLVLLSSGLLALGFGTRRRPGR